jgi:hypothetical protein
MLQETPAAQVNSYMLQETPAAQTSSPMKARNARRAGEITGGYATSR